MVYEGAILTVNEKNDKCKFLVEKDGRIVYVGNTLPNPYKEEERIQLGERCLMPSFVDTHLHFASLAMFHTGINVMDAKSNQEMLEQIKSFEKKSKAKLIIGFGASPHSVKEGVLLTRQELDTISNNRPIMVVKYDGHAAIVNSVLLEKLPEAIKTCRGYNPESGEMNQEAFFKTTDYVSASLSIVELVKSMEKTIDYMASKGIGMMHTVSGVGFPRDLDVDLERYVGRGVKGGFQTRLFFQTMDVKKVIKRKLPRIGGCFATALDGCFGSLDAALISPYEDSDSKGILYYSDEEVTQFCIEANRLGLQIELHAIGDRAFQQATRALKKALDDYPRKDHRHGIIHACLPTEEGLQICADYKIQIPLQTSFIDWAQEPDWYLQKILGEREAQLNPIGTYLRRGIICCAGSDAPCTDPNPFLWIHNSCNHPIENESISLDEAIRLCTWNGYYASFDEKERGSLEVGKIADMVIVSKNPYDVLRDQLKEIQAEQLILNGIPYKKQKANAFSLIFRGLISKGRI